MVKCSKGVHQLNIRSLYSISNLLLFQGFPQIIYILLGGVHHAPGASASICSRIGLSLTPGCPFMVVTAHESVFWWDRNWHYSLAFSDIQLCISPLRLQENWSPCSFCVFSLGFSFPATCGSGSHTLDSNCHFPWFEIPAAGLSLWTSHVFPMPVWPCFFFLRTTIHATPCQSFPVCQMVTN